MNDETGSQRKPNTLPKFASSGICIYLCCVAPGYEQDVASSLLLSCQSESKETMRYVYKIFGNPDLALVQLDYNGKNGLAIGNDKGITQCKKFVIYPWDYEVSEAKNAFDNLPVLAITRLKIPDELLIKYGISIEGNIVRSAQELIQSLNLNKELWVAASACLGWSEVILLTLAREPDAMLRYVSTAVSQLAVDSASGLVIHQERPEAKVVSLLGSSTIPGVKLTKGGVTTGIACKSIRFSLRVSCVPGHTSQMAADLDKTFGFADISLGYFDVECMGCKKNQLGEFVTALWDFRKRNSRSIYKTRTTITMPFKDWLQKTQKRESEQSKTIEITAIPPPSFDYGTVSKLTERTLRAVLDGELSKLRNYTTQPHTFGSFIDLFPFMKQLLKEVAEIDWDAESGHEIRILGDTTEMLRYAIDQRAIGSAPIGEYFEPSNLPPIGIQRNLLAARFYCRSILRRCGIPKEGEWKGFVMFGFSSEYKRYSGGIINFPTDAIDDPSRYWGAAHEVGHEIATHLKLLDDSEINYQLNRFGFSERKGLELVWEIFSEIICWLYGFGRHRWTQFIEKVWQYFGEQPRFQEHIDLYLSRFLVTAAYMKYLEGKIPITPDKEAMKEIEAEINKILLTGVPDIHRTLGPQTRESALSRATALVNVLPSMNDNFLKPLIANYAYPSEKETYQVYIKRGSVAPEVQNPADLIMCLAEDNQSGPREQAAILLTFWNQEVRLLRPE